MGYDSVHAREGEYAWVRYVHRRLENNKDFCVAIVGPTGSGKSYSAISIARLIDPEFTAERIAFTGLELIRLVQSEPKKGSVIVFEEAGVAIDSTKWASAINKAIKYLFQTVRHRNLVFILTLPSLNFLQKANRLLLHGTFITKGVNLELKVCKLDCKLLQYNPWNEHPYVKYLRVFTDTGVQPIKRWMVPKPPQELIEAYEAKKKKFTDKLFKLIEKELAQAEKDQEKAAGEARVAVCSCGYRWPPRTEFLTKCPRCQGRQVRWKDELEKDISGEVRV